MVAVPRGDEEVNGAALIPLAGYSGHDTSSGVKAQEGASAKVLVAKKVAWVCFLYQQMQLDAYACSDCI